MTFYLVDRQSQIKEELEAFRKKSEEAIRNMQALLMPTGTILPFGGATPPNSYLLCDGSAVSRTTYADLFAVIGTAYGAGDGSTTFNIPDMRECVPVGVGQNATNSIATHDTYTLGEFKDDSFKRHSHSFSGTTSTYNLRADESNEEANHFGSTGRVAGGAAEGHYSAVSNISHNHTFSGTTSNTGGTVTRTKQKGVNFIIKI